MEATIYKNKTCDCFQHPNFFFFKNELVKAGFTVSEVVQMSLKKQKVVVNDQTFVFDPLTLTGTIKRWVSSLISD
ncbi:MAG: hypothetical protein NC218_03655 [Acetobacter sp.]|nr:hypothetical protein [Acetobacter sp.]